VAASCTKVIPEVVVPHSFHMLTLGVLQISNGLFICGLLAKACQSTQRQPHCHPEAIIFLESCATCGDQKAAQLV
jgi:hypothetical protein